MVSQVEKAVKFLLWYKNPTVFFKDVFGIEPFPYQAEVLKASTREKRIIIQAASSTGKTKLLASIALYHAIVISTIEREPVKVIIISGSRDQAKYLYDYCKEVLDNQYIVNEIEGEPLQSITKFKNGSEIRALPNSLKAIQGKHGDIVIIDEAVLAGDFLIRDALRITAGSKRDLIILSGTPMNAASLFCTIFRDVESYPEWKRFHWTVKDCPRITAEQLAEANKLPEEIKQVFWEGKPYYEKLQTVVDFESLKNCVKDIPLYDIDPNGDRIVAGIDWGWTHYTAIVVIQKVDDIFRVLYCDQWRREQFEDLHDKIEEICRKYNVSEIYTDQEDIGENQRLESRGLNVIPIPFQGKKAQMQTHLRIIFHQNKIRIPQVFQNLIQQLRSYTYNSKSNDDLVDALMLAVYNYDKESKTNELWWQIL